MTMLATMWAALGGDPARTARVRVVGERVLPSCYPMTDLGAAAFAAAGLAVAEVAGTAEPVVVDRTLCTGWFHRASRPLVATPRRSPFHALSGDFPTADGRWVRFQANYPHLRRKALAALGADPDGAGVAEVVAAHPADEVEAAVLAAGGAAAATRTVAEWRAHPQGRAVAAEPLVTVETATAEVTWRSRVAERPLAGLRVLDLTRVLAGPLASRFLAACGADVLRIDAPGYTEPTGHPGDLTLGKRCAVLDLAEAQGRQRFLDLLADADVLVHGLRPGALERLALGRAERAAHRPGLVEITLNAYGWTGSWAGRRGFDTLVQAACGMALAGGDWTGAGTPHRWPLSILDHTAGYLMAAAAIRALTRGTGSLSRVSLAGVAQLLLDAEPGAGGPALELPVAGPLDPTVYSGLVRRLGWPLTVPPVQFGWDRPADPYGTATPTWVF
jgi:crotonobetainyl-CoA:carnitine CoA-transferase CaiB-like acyl-CoA transferase